MTEKVLDFSEISLLSFSTDLNVMISPDAEKQVLAMASFSLSIDITTQKYNISILKFNDTRYV